MTEMTTLGEMTTKIGSGATPRGGSSVYLAEGTALIRSQNVLDLSFKHEGLARISDEDAEKLKGVTVEEHDVLINITGDSILRTTLVPRYVLPARVNQHVAILRADAERLDPWFLQYHLVSPNTRAALDAVSRSGATRAALTKRHLEMLAFPALPLEEQRRISHVLKSLDDKIEANTKLAHTADELASALYLEATSTDPELVPLSSLADFVNGKAFTKNATGDGRIVVRIAEMNNGIGPSTIYNDLEVPSQHVAFPGDILFSWSGSLTVMRWQLSEAIINQHIFKVIPKASIPAWLVYAALSEKLKHFKQIAADKATTMGHIQRKHLDELVAVPSKASVQDLAPQMTILWDASFTALQENRQLAELRDYLLPRLMSGKVTVRNAEGHVSD